MSMLAGLSFIRSIATKTRLAIGVLVLVVLAGMWYWRLTAVAQESAGREEYVVELSDLNYDLNLPGRLAFDKQASLKFQTSGLLSWVGVKPGDRVKKGQAIASLDRRQLYKQLQKSLNSYYKTRLDFEETEDEYRDVLDRSTTIQRLLEKNQKDLDNSVIDVELKHIAWRLAVITAPFDGIVDALSLPSPGVNITPAKTTFNLVDPDSLYFKAEIDEMDISQVQLSVPVLVELDAYPDIKLNGQLEYISLTPVAGRGGTQVYPAKIKLIDKPADIGLRSGLGGQARIRLESRSSVLVVPIDYVYYQKSKPYVWLKTAKGKLTRRWIKTGLESEEFIEVVSGLNQNDVIVRK